MLKKIALALVFSVLIGLIGPVHADQTFVMMGLEYEESNHVWSENLFFERMKEITGVAFSFHQSTKKDAYETAKQKAFAPGGQLPDVLFKADLSPEEEMTYLKNGQLVDLAPLIPEYMPNLNSILSAREDWRSMITQPDGAIASLPVLRGNEKQNVFWINQKWLTALSLQMPETIDEYTDVLRAFRDQDPNGNGKDDEIPLDIIGPWEAKFLLHAFGIVSNDYHIYLDEAGLVQFAAFDPGFRDFVSWLQMALQERLINPQVFRQTHAERSAASQVNTDEKTPQVIGSMVSIAPYTKVRLEETMDYALMPPLESNGKQVYRQFLSGVGRGAFAVTSACQDIPAILQWADVLYTEEGGRLAFAGLEGEDYRITEDGTWAWNGSGDYYAINEILSKAIIADESRMPGLEPAGFMRSSEIQAENYVRKQMDIIRPYLVEPYPVTWPTDANRESRIASLQAELAVCIDTAIANFAMGKTDLTDENWQAFQDELRALGANEFIELWQQKYDEMK